MADQNDLSTALASLGRTGAQENDVKDFLITEYGCAWEAHRHLENLRARYLAFLFTISFAGLALLGSIIKEIKDDRLEALLLSLLVSILSYYIITVIGKLIESIKVIFPHYEGIWKGVRIHFTNENIETLLNVRGNSAVKGRKKKFSKSLDNISSFLQYLYLFLSIAIAARIIYLYYPFNDILSSTIGCIKGIT